VPTSVSVSFVGLYQSVFAVTGIIFPVETKKKKKEEDWLLVGGREGRHNILQIFSAVIYV